jgi:antitoxin MazE
VIKKLVRHGNSYALVIDRPILDLLKIEPDTPLEITTDGSVLTITPIRDQKIIKEFEKSQLPENRPFKYGVVLRDNDRDIELVVNGVSKGKLDKDSVIDFFTRKRKVQK